MLFLNCAVTTTKFFCRVSGNPDLEEGVTIRFSHLHYDKKRESLNRLANNLRSAGVEWLRPFNLPTEDWILNASMLKRHEPKLALVDWFQGTIRITPDYDSEEIEIFNRRNKEVNIRFVCTLDDIRRSLYVNQFPELQTYLDRFFTDYPHPQTCGFLMMKYQDSPLHRKIVKVLREVCSQQGLTLLRADDKVYSDELLSNIQTYMHGCRFGIAVFDRLKDNDFNPNVSLEVGYMMALKKPVCFMKDNTLPNLHTDLIGRLYAPFDTQAPETTIPPVLKRWLIDKEFIES